MPNRRVIHCLLIISWLITIPLSTVAQTIDKELETWRDLLFELLDEGETEEDIDILTDRLSQLINNPVCINSCSREELEQIPFLSDEQVEGILAYRYRVGELVSPGDLRFIRELDYRTIRCILPFFSFEKSSDHAEKSVDNLFRTLHHKAVISYKSILNRKEGYVDKSDSLLAVNPNLRYLGTPAYGAVRYQLQAGKRWSAGFVAEKDAGERGVDYLNGYVQLQNAGIVRRFIVGSYRAHVGLGLVINNSFSLGKTSLSLSSLSRSAGFSPMASTDEWNYLRGVALELQRRRWRVAVGWSMRSLDGIATTDTLTSLKKDGLHRLPRDLEKQGAAEVVSTVVATGWTGRRGSIALNGALHVFDKVWMPTRNNYMNRPFTGSQLGSASVDYRWNASLFTLRGEAAVAENGGIGLLNIVSLRPMTPIALSLLHRYYDKRFHGFMNKGFGETSDLCGEQGVALFAESQVRRSLLLKSSVDIFRISTARSGIALPSHGFETRFQTSYQPNERLDFSFGYRLKQKQITNTSAGDSLGLLTSYQQHRMELRLNVVLSENFYLKSAVGATFYKPENAGLSTGLLITQAVGYLSKNIPLQFDLQASAFNTTDTRASVSLSERSILYGSGVSSLSGEGMRLSINARYALGERLTLLGKLGATRYFDRDEIGSGLELIHGSVKADVSLQLQFKL